MAGNKKDKIYAVGGSDSRSGPERLAALVNRAFAKDKTPRAGDSDKPAPKPAKQWGEPAEMSEAQKIKLRKLRGKAK